jgi:hypothetical protein
MENTTAVGTPGAAGYSAASPEAQPVSGKATVAAQPIARPDPTPIPAPLSRQHIDLTVPNDHGHPVDIRIAQRAGNVEVTVRTPDGSLAQSLRHHLPELSENLARNGLRSDFFESPGQSAARQKDQGEGSKGHSPEQDHREPDGQSQRESKSPGKERQYGTFAETIHTEKRSII